MMFDYETEDYRARSQKFINVGFSLIPIVSLDEAAQKIELRKEITHHRQITIRRPKEIRFRDLSTLSTSGFGYETEIEELYPVYLNEECSVIHGLMQLFSTHQNIYQCGENITDKDYQKAAESIAYHERVDIGNAWIGKDMSVLFSTSPRELMCFAACDMSGKITHMSKVICLRPKSMIVLKSHKQL